MQTPRILNRILGSLTAMPPKLNGKLKFYINGVVQSYHFPVHFELIKID